MKQAEGREIFRAELRNTLGGVVDKIASMQSTIDDLQATNTKQRRIIEGQEGVIESLDTRLENNLDCYERALEETEKALAECRSKLAKYDEKSHRGAVSINCCMVDKIKHTDYFSYKTGTCPGCEFEPQTWIILRKERYIEIDNDLRIAQSKCKNSDKALDTLRQLNSKLGERIKSQQVRHEKAERKLESALSKLKADCRSKSPLSDDERLAKAVESHRVSKEKMSATIAGLNETVATLQQKLAHTKSKLHTAWIDFKRDRDAFERQSCQQKQDLNTLRMCETVNRFIEATCERLTGLKKDKMTHNNIHTLLETPGADSAVRSSLGVGLDTFTTAYMKLRARRNDIAHPTCTVDVELTKRTLMI